MDRYKILEDRLREDSNKGDLEGVLEIISKGVNVNCTNAINGWTPLHWAAKRGHKEVVRTLLEAGANPNPVSEKGETPAAITNSPEIRALLAAAADSSPSHPGLTSVPTAARTVVPPKHDLTNGYHHHQHPFHHSSAPDPGELVLKVRVANGGDPDFIEVELSRTELTYYSLLRVCCDELGIAASQVARIRKLPDTMLRKDKDIQRLAPMQELEVVLQGGPLARTPNGYKSIQHYKNQTILY